MRERPVCAPGARAAHPPPQLIARRAACRAAAGPGAAPGRRARAQTPPWISELRAELRAARRRDTITLAWPISRRLFWLALSRAGSAGLVLLAAGVGIVAYGLTRKALSATLPHGGLIRVGLFKFSLPSCLPTYCNRSTARELHLGRPLPGRAR